MKLRFFSICAALGLVATASQAASTLMDMRFNNAGGEINEAALNGWDGTTLAAGGTIAPNLVVTQGMKINGDFNAGAQNDAFHVDNWQSPNVNPTTTFVSIVLGAQSGYAFDLSGTGASFSTLLHQHPKNETTQMFNRVRLEVNGTDLGLQNYTPGNTPQTLSWDLSTSGLTGLSSATFKLYFTNTNGAGADPSNNNHGPEWALNDNAFVQVNGFVVAIPEPSRALLSMGGFLCLAIRRRRK